MRKPTANGGDKPLTPDEVKEIQVMEASVQRALVALGLAHVQAAAAEVQCAKALDEVAAWSQRRDARVADFARAHGIEDNKDGPKYTFDTQNPTAFKVVRPPPT